MLATTTLGPGLTFEQFLEQCPEDGSYELIGGAVVKILATRRHEDVADFIAESFNDERRRLELPYKISDRIVIATETEAGKIQGRHPDVSVVDSEVWRANRTAYTALREPIQLAVEVVSSNWEDDHDLGNSPVDKLDEYARLGIREYWIVDYLAIGSRAFLGYPKEPAVFVFLLDEDGVYQMTRFQGSDRIYSATFPGLEVSITTILSV